MKNIWVKASAGTGKTRALVNRVLSLLVTGHKGILCLTFTNSAAEEMLSRISRTLRNWVLIPENELITQLKNLTKFYNDNSINYVRSLFCRLSKLLMVKTIHSFCYEIITDFPKESGISYNAKILEYKDELYQQAINCFLSQQQDLGEIALDLSKKKLFDMCMELSNKIENYQLYSDYLQKLKIGLNPPEKKDLSKLISIMMQGSDRDVKYAKLIKNNEEKVLLNTDGDKKKTSSIITKKSLTRFPKAENLIIVAQENCYIRNNIRSKLKIIQRTESILKIIHEINKIFHQLKKDYITYDEVITLSLKLLKNPKYRDWVMFSIHDKVQHILIDEAQDNSKEQWEIIRLLSEDFFSGIGAGGVQNTIFVVGDIKQSIYSFQGAEPRLFNIMQKYFTDKAAVFNQEIVERNLTTSYRSAVKILESVDKIFNRKEILANNFGSDSPIKHICHRKNETGHIEIWPLIEKNEESDSDDKLLLAQKITEKILTLVRNKDIAENEITVLVRRRDAFMHHLISELRKKKLATSGYDRCTITDHIIIRDLISLGKIMLSPENDFELAKVLKSPIFNLSENDIFTLCYDRKEKSVWQKLDEQQPNIFHKINNWQKGKVTTFEFYYRIINRENFPQKHPEIIEKFLELAWDKPILSDFLQFIESNKIEVKNNQTNGIKVMTVHNAKGLEAKVVFLADTTQIPVNKNHFTFNEEGIPFYLKNDSFDNIKEQANKKAYEEYIRLLYVALTRAQDRLYITGSGKAKKGSWYDLISASMTQS
ncbi:MAG: UvrD-helicase domain-containing protein [Rickettsiaceae bacterium H1]|nr:UvrD-helicase domain-containing protein [Rickettsiaceae bacterium H1]